MWKDQTKTDASSPELPMEDGLFLRFVLNSLLNPKGERESTHSDAELFFF